MVSFPKTIRAYCPRRSCKSHKSFKVMQYKAGKKHSFCQGERRYQRKQAGYGGQTKPVFHKKAKTTKKILLKLQCAECKSYVQRCLKRTKHFEIDPKKK
mmetsp:Transcript_2010/g.2889  ORF Transcript_2010/g.2889 Transcript_2010/m.2889 type:complete len:99 (-) Transcript_2010:182-478(-)